MINRGAGEIALALQTARGSVASVSTQRSNVVSNDLDPTFGLNPNPEVRVGRIAGTPWRSATGGEGQFTIAVRPKIIGLLLYAALGSKSVSGASDPWTHTFTLGSTIPWLTAWRHYAGIENDRFMDARLTSLTITSTSKGLVTAQASLVAATAAYRTAQETTAAVESADLFEHRHGASALLVEGTSFSPIDAWSLTIRTGVALEQSLAGPMPRMTGLASIAMVIHHTVPDMALWRRMIYGSSSPSNLAAPATAPLVLAGSPVGVQFTLTEQTGPTRSLRIALPSVALGPIDGLEPIPSYGPAEATTSLLAYGTTMTATLLNSQSAY
jgi:hypothetical protein